MKKKEFKSTNHLLWSIKKSEVILQYKMNSFNIYSSKISLYNVLKMMILNLLLFPTKTIGKNKIFQVI